MLWLSSFSNLLRFFAVMLFVAACQSAFALDANKADIHLDSNLKQINIIVGSSSSAGGCPSGQYWDTGKGRCTTEVLLRTVNVTESCSCSCGSGTSGSCTSSRDGSYGVYGWTTPPSGQEKISYNSATNWGGCYSTSNSCVADPPADSGGGGDTGAAPTPGTVLYITAYICDASNPDYYNGPLGASEKDKLISAYRKFSSGSRCPELAGYVFWQNATIGYAQNYLASNPGTSYADAIAIVFNKTTYPAMNEAAASNNEGDSAHLAVLDAYCSTYASDKYGVPISATYVFGSGSSCVVN